MYHYITSVFLLLNAFTSYAETFKELYDRLQSPDPAVRLKVIPEFEAYAKTGQAFNAYSVLYDASLKDPDQTVSDSAYDAWHHIASDNPKILGEAILYLRQFLNAHGWNGDTPQHKAMRTKLSFIFFVHAEPLRKYDPPSPDEMVEIALVLEKPMLDRSQGMGSVKNQLFFMSIYFNLRAGLYGDKLSIPSWETLNQSVERLSETPAIMSPVDQMILGLFLSGIHRRANRMAEDAQEKGWTRTPLERIYQSFRLLVFLSKQIFITKDHESFREAVIRDVRIMSQILRREASQQYDNGVRRGLITYARRFEIFLKVSKEELKRDQERIDSWMSLFYEEGSEVQYLSPNSSDANVGRRFCVECFLSRSDRSLAYQIDRLNKSHPESAMRRLILSIREVGPTRVEGLANASPLCRRVWKENPTDPKL